MVFICFVLAIYGLIFGSFVNAAVWRFHAQEEVMRGVKSGKGKRQRAKKAHDSDPKIKNQKLAARTAPIAITTHNLSLATGRSMCSHCRHPLAAKDLVPLFSWLYLRGKCRYCGVKIEDSPLIEVITPLLFVVSYLCWPLELHGAGLVQFGFWLAFLVGFMFLAAYDLRWFLLPNRVVFPLIGLGAVQVITVAIIRHDVWVLINAGLGALLLSGLFWVLFQVSNGQWIGGGDVKLAVLLGLLAGTPELAVLLLFAASVAGTLVSIPVLLQGKRGLTVRVPFGPYLLAGTVFVVLFGQRIIDWYSSLLTNI